MSLHKYQPYTFFYLFILALFVLTNCSKDNSETKGTSFTIKIAHNQDQIFEGAIIPISFLSSNPSEISNISIYVNNTKVGQTSNISDIFYIDLKDTVAGPINIKATCHFHDNQQLSDDINLTLKEPNVQCGESIADIDGNQYNTVLIGNQCWMQSNLKTTRYADGETLINGLENTPPNRFSEPPGWYFAFDGLESNADIYGYLYSFYTTVRVGSDTRKDSKHVKGICPDGWHVPSIDEWRQLINHVGGLENAGVKLRANSINSNGFKALMAGNCASYFSGCIDQGDAAYFWTSTPSIPSHSYHIYMSQHLNKASIFSGINSKLFGMSVRCIKD